MDIPTKETINELTVRRAIQGYNPLKDFKDDFVLIENLPADSPLIERGYGENPICPICDTLMKDGEFMDEYVDDGYMFVYNIFKCKECSVHINTTYIYQAIDDEIRGKFIEIGDSMITIEGEK